jgi:hypothetical protein
LNCELEAFCVACCGEVSEGEVPAREFFAGRAGDDEVGAVTAHRVNRDRQSAPVQLAGVAVVFNVDADASPAERKRWFGPSAAAAEEVK